MSRKLFTFVATQIFKTYFMLGNHGRRSLHLTSLDACRRSFILRNIFLKFVISKGNSTTSENIPFNLSVLNLKKKNDYHACGVTKGRPEILLDRKYSFVSVRSVTVMLYNQINCHTHFLSSAKRRNSAPIETRSLGWTPLPLTLRYKILNLYKIASIVINVTYSIPVKNKCKGMYIYSVFFFIESKVFVNLTYLYLSEIKKQGLIFSVGMGHLIICKKM